MFFCRLVFFFYRPNQYWRSVFLDVRLKYMSNRYSNTTITLTVLCLIALASSCGGGRHRARRTLRYSYDSLKDDRGDMRESEVWDSNQEIEQDQVLNGVYAFDSLLDKKDKKRYGKHIRDNQQRYRDRAIYRARAERRLNEHLPELGEDPFGESGDRSEKAVAEALFGEGYDKGGSETLKNKLTDREALAKELFGSRWKEKSDSLIMARRDSLGAGERKLDSLSALREKLEKTDWEKALQDSLETRNIRRYLADSLGKEAWKSHLLDSLRSRGWSEDSLEAFRDRANRVPFDSLRNRFPNIGSPEYLGDRALVALEDSLRKRKGIQKANRGARRSGKKTRTA